MVKKKTKTKKLVQDIKPPKKGTGEATPGIGEKVNKTGLEVPDNAKLSVTGKQVKVVNEKGKVMRIFTPAQSDPKGVNEGNDYIKKAKLYAEKRGWRVA